MNISFIHALGLRGLLVETNRQQLALRKVLRPLDLSLSVSAQWKVKVKVAFSSGFLRKTGRTAHSHKA